MPKSALPAETSCEFTLHNDLCKLGFCWEGPAKGKALKAANLRHTVEEFHWKADIKQTAEIKNALYEECPFQAIYEEIVIFQQVKAEFKTLG